MDKQREASCEPVFSSVTTPLRGFAAAAAGPRERRRNESGNASCAAATASNEKSRANKSKQIMVAGASGVTGLTRSVRRDSCGLLLFAAAESHTSKVTSPAATRLALRQHNSQVGNPVVGIGGTAPLQFNFIQKISQY